MLWAGASLPVRTLAEFIEHAAARPGHFNYASGGVGSSNHVDAELFMAATGLRLVHVPYTAIAAVGSGEVQMMIVSITTGMPLAQGGRIRPLTVFGAARSPLIPEVPTAGELGLSDVDLAAWIGLVAPSGTPEDVAGHINAQLARLLRAPETIAWARRHGLEIVGGSPQEFARTLERDYERWGRTIRGLRLSPQ